MTIPTRRAHTRLRWDVISILLTIALALTACGDPESLPGTAASDPPPTSTSAPTTTTAAIPATTTTHDLRYAECVAALVPGASTVPCEGVLYDLGIPEGCFDTPCGLIVDFPPGEFNGAQTDAHTNLQTLGNEAGYVVVQPSSGMGALRAARDRAFLDALIATLDIDPSRVHVGGASRGGWQSWHFICDHADLIASAAPHASGAGDPGASCDFDENRSPVEQVDILITHGRNDSKVPFAGGVAQLELVADSWGMTVSEVLVDDTDYRWTRWTNDEGTVVEFIEFDWTTPAGEGHCYPGADGSGGCGSDTPIHYGETALAFYIAHPKDG